MGGGAGGYGAPAVPPPVVPPPSRGDDFDMFIGESQDAGRRTVNATPIVLGLIGLLVVFGVWWAFKSLTAPPSVGGDTGIDLTGNGAAAPDDEGEGEDTAPDEDPAPQPPPADPTTAPPPSGAAPVIASVQMLDPPPGGDNNEHPEAVHLAVDGDPTTKWFSRMYNNPEFGMKPGIGYAITLTEPATVTTITLLTGGSGGNVEVRATDPSTPTEGPVLASGPMSATTVLTLSQPTQAQHIVLWFTVLPQNAAGENRVELFEVQLS